MIEYLISYRNPNTHIIDIEVTIRGVKENDLLINIPSWRPGRYELANYAKNIYRMEALSFDEGYLECRKISKDRWKVETKGRESVKLKYSYYAFQMDAGNSWLDDEQLYINPINCLVYIKERMNERCFLTLNIPASYKVATGLKEVSSYKFVAKDYFELSDCPIFASPTLKCLRYIIDEIDFYIWVQGEFLLNEENLIRDFTSFSQYQINLMGGFPEKEYHFMFQFLNHSFRHGVEHRNSTVITIGPATSISTTLYNDLLGISSHELFHSWNVLKIRPLELYPYDFSCENYFETGYIAEGFTTYYGDLILARCGCFTFDQYFSELNDVFKKHFDNEGNLNLSLAESSFDLWLDGYSSSTPNRKVSIYIKGAVVAFLIDIKIRNESKNKYSLDDVMRLLWKEFGKKSRGYSDTEIIEIIRTELGINIESLIKTGVYETTYLEKEIYVALDFLGLDLLKKTSAFPIETDFGIRLINSNGKWIVEELKKDSGASKILSKADEIIAINHSKFDPTISLDAPEILLTFLRGKRYITEVLKKEKKSFYQIPVVSLKSDISSQQKENIKNWLEIAV